MPACTKAKGNRQVHWNTIWEELKAKAKKALEDDEKSVRSRRCCLLNTRSNLSRGTNLNLAEGPLLKNTS
ncbi:hypothetical protein [Paenibacillus agaridevorans]|uniref:hypothetical protein n=1 Tax=Paenibacillus agaridevorans TaxID=171404 RepID=UPI000D59ADE4